MAFQLSDSFTIAGFDPSPVVSLVGPLLREWADLRFDAGGSVINPDTDETVERVRLISGTHRVAGATYQLDAVATNPADTSVFFDLDSDTGTSLTGTVRVPSAGIEAAVGAEFGTLAAPTVPTIAVGGTVLFDTMDQLDGLPKFLARRIAQPATLTGSFTPSVWLGGVNNATSLEGSIDHKLLRASVVVETKRKSLTTNETSNTVRLTFRLRGWARIAGPLVRKALIQSFDERIKEAAGFGAALPEKIARLEREIADAGGPDLAVHRGVWDPNGPIAEPPSLG